MRDRVRHRLVERGRGRRGGSPLRRRTRSSPASWATCGSTPRPRCARPDGWEIGTLCVFDDRAARRSPTPSATACRPSPGRSSTCSSCGRRTRLLQAKIAELERSQQQLVSFAGPDQPRPEDPPDLDHRLRRDGARTAPRWRGDEVALRYVERTQALGAPDARAHRRPARLRPGRRPAAARARSRSRPVFEQVKSDLRWAARRRRGAWRRARTPPSTATRRRSGCSCRTCSPTP